jgi:hypothetical protein
VFGSSLLFVYDAAAVTRYLAGLITDQQALISFTVKFNIYFKLGLFVYILLPAFFILTQRTVVYLLTVFCYRLFYMLTKVTKQSLKQSLS